MNAEQSLWRRFLHRLRRKEEEPEMPPGKLVLLSLKPEPDVPTPPELDRAASAFARDFLSHVGGLFGGPPYEGPPRRRIFRDLHGHAFQKAPAQPLVENNFKKEGQFPEK